MKDVPDSNDTELLPTLYERIERAWNERRDHSLVDTLAEEHPSLAASLYEFFALVIAAQCEADERRPEFTSLDATASAWLQTGGLEAIRAGALIPLSTGTTQPAAPSVRNDSTLADAPA